MSKFESTFKSAIAENERRVLIDSLRSSPELSLGEIARLSKGGLGRLFSNITIADLMGGTSAGASHSAPARRGRPPRSEVASTDDMSAGKASKATKVSSDKQRRGGKARAVHTRTAEGRAEYDEALFQAVHDHQGPIGAGAIIARAGGSSLQARAGLARLIEAGRITWSGKARGTKYSAV